MQNVEFRAGNIEFRSLWRGTLAPSSLEKGLGMRQILKFDKVGLVKTERL